MDWKEENRASGNSGSENEESEENELNSSSDDDNNAPTESERVSSSSYFTHYSILFEKYHKFQLKLINH